MLNDFSYERKTMVERQLRARGINDERILAAFETTPRHLFVPEELRHLAYADCPHRIGFGQTISQPFIVAYMVQLLALMGAERVLEVGTGSGYQAAILAQLAQEVHTVELIPDLAKRAAHILSQFGVMNVFVHVGDGSQGWQEYAPYDAIIVSAAASYVSKSLLSQLMNHGRLILPVAAHGTQDLQLWQREGDKFTHEILLAVAFVPLHGKEGV